MGPDKGDFARDYAIGADVKAAPMATTFAAAEEAATAPKVRHWTDTADPDGPEWAQLRASRAATAIGRAMNEERKA